jgi:Flp pilus assembly protein TadD
LDYAAERRLYLPSIGFFIVLLWGLSKLFEPGSKAPRWTVAALALIYCGGTYARSQVWSDEYAIWADTVAKSPRKERPLTWLGRVAFQRGLNDEALRHWTEAEKLTEPGSDQQVYLLVNIGLAHARAKNYEEAIRSYRKALNIKDNDGRIWAQLAVAQIRAGFKDEGWESFGTAFKHQRRMGPEVLTLAAQELFVDGRYREAAKFYADALEYRPDDMEVRRNLEIALQRAAQAGQ